MRDVPRLDDEPEVTGVVDRVTALSPDQATGQAYWPAYSASVTSHVPDSPPPPRRRWVVLVAVLVACLVVGVGVGLGWGMRLGGQPPTGGGRAVPALPGVVAVNAGGTGLTTGVLVNQDGFVVVALDAILGAGELTVTLPDGNRASQTPAEFVGFDVAWDLAVLRAPGLVGARPARLAPDSVGGADAVRLVNQFGVAPQIQVPAEITGTADYPMIRTGGSYLAIVFDAIGLTTGWFDPVGGAALVDADGAVAGLVIRTDIMSSDIRGAPHTQMYAAPVDAIRQVVALVQAGGTTETGRAGPLGDLGFSYQVEPAHPSDWVAVTAVAPHGPAAQAGIRLGDQLLGLNGVDLSHNRGATIGIEGLIRRLVPGSLATLEWRHPEAEAQTSELTVQAA
jgi:S1-C subfamily serine protease